MIKVGIIGNLQDEDQIYRILYQNKKVESVGVYSPERDFKSAKFKIYHNPIELLEVSDAILIDDAQGISADFIQMMIRKSIHIYFRKLPLLTPAEMGDLYKLQKEAGNVVHLFNPLLWVFPEIKNEMKAGAKIVLLQLSLKRRETVSAPQLMGILAFLCKIENATVKHSDVLALKGEEGLVTIHIHLQSSNGSVHNILLSNHSKHSEIQVFQACKTIAFDFENTEQQKKNGLSAEELAFHNFIEAVNGADNAGILLDDLINSQKSYLDICEKLNYSGINI